ncbi:MAG: glycosyltransferase family 39 protein [Chloroflexota bacterium]
MNRIPRHRLLLFFIFVLALFLRLFRIGLDGFSNLYYAATVKSMSMGWHNFFYAAFDPAGFVSVDKPPLGFWIQTLSAKVFGFHGWALILPQALAGALSTLVLYHIVKRVFGVNAGLVAALILAVTPVSVAVHRSNTPDGQLTFVLLLAALAALDAAETGKLRWLLACAALVGLGFNIKMLQAYILLPVFFIFLPPPLPLLKRLGQLVLAGLVLFIVSFTWVIAVELTPPASRPYVSSTGTNHVIELIAVHNGVRRLGPIAEWIGIRPLGADSTSASNSDPQPAPAQNVTPSPQPDSDKPWPDGGFNEVGEPGVLRLFNPQMAGQVGWLLHLALLSLIASAPRVSWKQPLGREPLFFLLWGTWLFTAAFFFSFGGLIHRYYLDMLAPPIAALSAVGLTNWVDSLRAGQRRGWLLPLSVAVTTALAIFFLGYYPEARWLVLPVALLGGVTFFLILPSRASSLRGEALMPLTLASILFAPLVWSTTPMWRGGDVILPYAGADLVYWGGDRGEMKAYAPLAAYLENQNGSEEFILATDVANMAAPVILLTGRAVMATGGFTGGDPILTMEEFAEYILDGRLRFVLTASDGESTFTQWLKDNCQIVPPGAWRVSPGMLDEFALYDCKP